MNRVMKLFSHLPEVLERDARGEPPLFPPAIPCSTPASICPSCRPGPGTTRPPSPGRPASRRLMTACGRSWPRSSTSSG